MLTRSTYSHPTWQLRVLRETPHRPGNSRNVHGGAVFFPPDLVVTCAHVVCSAVGLVFATGVAAPDNPVYLDSVSDDWRGEAKVVPECWFVDENGVDLAVLRLTTPAPLRAEAPVIRLPNQLNGGLLTSVGYPPRLEAGDPVEVRIIGQGGRSSGLLKLASVSAVAGHMEPGFSGCAVKDGTGAVCGIVVDTRVVGRRGTGEAWMLPMTEIQRRWPSGAQWPEPDAPVRRSGGYPELTTALMRLEVFRRALSADEIDWLFPRGQWPPHVSTGGGAGDAVRSIVESAPDRWELLACLQRVQDLQRDLGDYSEATADHVLRAAEPLVRQLDRELTGADTYAALHDFLDAIPLRDVNRHLHAFYRGHYDGMSERLRAGASAETAWTAFVRMWTWPRPDRDSPPPRAVWVELMVRERPFGLVPPAVRRWLDDQRSDHRPHDWERAVGRYAVAAKELEASDDAPVRLVASVIPAAQGYDLAFFVGFPETEGGGANSTMQTVRWRSAPHRLRAADRSALSTAIVRAARDVEETLPSPYTGRSVVVEPLVAMDDLDLGLASRRMDGRGREPAHIGSQYAIRLHLRDRRVGRRFADKSELVDGGRVVWVRDVPPELLASALSAHDVVACVLDRPPWHDPHAFEYAVDGHVPIMLWAREDAVGGIGIRGAKGTPVIPTPERDFGLGLISGLISPGHEDALAGAQRDFARWGLIGLPRILLKLRSNSYDESDFDTAGLSYSIDFLYDTMADLAGGSPFKGRMRLTATPYIPVE
ncbi:hypothetical protein GCM10009834_09690 [Streptomonospora arabica]